MERGVKQTESLGKVRAHVGSTLSLWTFCSGAFLLDPFGRCFSWLREACEARLSRRNEFQVCKLRGRFDLGMSCCLYFTYVCCWKLKDFPELSHCLLTRSWKSLPVNSNHSETIPRRKCWQMLADVDRCWKCLSSIMRQIASRRRWENPMVCSQRPQRGLFGVSCNVTPLLLPLESVKLLQHMARVARATPYWGVVYFRYTKRTRPNWCQSIVEDGTMHQCSTMFY